MSYFVYVLRSASHQTRYVGCAAYSEIRLNEHNAGRCRYTSGRRPWKIVYQEEWPTLSDARRREKKLKYGQGREELNKILG